MIFGPGGPPVYCPDEHLTVEEIHEATKVYAAFAALALDAARRGLTTWTAPRGFDNVLDRCLAVRPGEQVMLLTDDGTDGEVVAGLVAGIEAQARCAGRLPDPHAPAARLGAARARSPRPCARRAPSSS